MTPKNNTPLVREIALAILQFLAASADDQLCALRNYENMLKSGHLQQAHMWNPFVEVAEGLLKLNTESKIESFTAESIVAIDEVECVLRLIFNQSEGCNVDDEQILTGPEWRVIRRLAAHALEVVSDSRIELSLSDILTHVAD